MFLLSYLILSLFTISPALAIPPPNFGFPEAPNDTALTVTYNDITVREGQLFGGAIASSTPSLSVNAGGFQSLADYNGSYTVVMVDPDARFPENPTSRFILHWLVPDFAQGPPDGQGQRPLTNTSAAFVPYAPPNPPTNSSAHRYILYAFRRPSNFSIPLAFQTFSAQNRQKFNLTSFIADASLGEPTAAMYYYVSKEPNVLAGFTADPGSEYPGGNGNAVTSGDPASATASATGARESTSTATSAETAGTGASATGSAPEATASEGPTGTSSGTGTGNSSGGSGLKTLRTGLIRADMILCVGALALL